MFYTSSIQVCPKKSVRKISLQAPKRMCTLLQFYYGIPLYFRETTYQAVEKVQSASADYFFVRCMGHKSPMLPQKKQSFLHLTLFELPEKNEDFGLF